MEVINISIADTKKAVFEGAVIITLCMIGIYSFIVKDYTNGAWALGLAGGYVFKNGVQSKKVDDAT